jgi:pSer/pThr/pTyr-binding forkhead associated (FHA) protein
MPTLLVQAPDGTRRRVAIDRFPFSIGRQPGNGLVLLDDRVSRHHARIVDGPGGLSVEDLNSRHGVYVNGERVVRRSFVLGDAVELGSGLGLT